jgi:hypothetical protein
MEHAASSPALETTKRTNYPEYLYKNKVSYVIILYMELLRTYREKITCSPVMLIMDI